MDLSFVRGEGRSYFALARRDDRVVVRLKGGSYDRSDPPLPHDLAHFVVEDEFELRAGLWSVIAAGGLFRQSSVVSGRQRPHAARCAREVIKQAGDRLTQAEVVVSALCAVARAGDDGDPRALERIPDRWRPQGIRPYDVKRACERLRAAARRWSAVSEGDSLQLVWSVVPDSRLGHRPGGARRRRR